jgi:MFS family permease
MPFSSATVLAVVAFTTFTGFLFLNSLYLQDTRGLRASDAGLCMLPIALALVICSPLSGRLVGAGHARRALVISGCATMIGAGLLSNLRIDTPLWQLLVAYAILGVGIGMVNAPITNAAVTGMPRAQAGFAAALASTSRQVGATFGVALGGMIVGGTSAYSPGFALAVRPFCWLAVACGAIVVCLGIAATTARARESVQRVAALLDAPDLLD